MSAQGIFGAQFLQVFTSEVYTATVFSNINDGNYFKIVKVDGLQWHDVLRKPIQ